MTTVGTEYTWHGAFAPPSISNVGPGFDCFGFAIDIPGDRVFARLTVTPGERTIVSIEGDDGVLPKEIDQNTAGMAAVTLFDELAPPNIKDAHGLELRIIKQMPIGSGIGSSAVSAVAGAYATMHLLTQEAHLVHNEEAILRAALAGETIAAGDLVADNIAPSLMGGFTVVQSVDPPIVTRFEPQLRCRIVVTTPHMRITTREAREILPQEVPLRDAIRNTSNAASLVLALLTANDRLLRNAMTDHIIEPHRAKLIPGYADARETAITRGAYGCSISGSGPTIFALCPNQPTAMSVREGIEQIFSRHDLTCTSYITGFNTHGARPL